MRFKNKFTDWLYNNPWLFWVFFAAILICCVLFCNGCKHTEYIEKTDTLYVSKVDIQYVERVDSVWRDRWHTIEVKGDTIYQYDSIYYGGWHYIYDTIILTDTIYQSKEATEVVAKPQHHGEFIALLGIAALFIILVIVGRIADIKHHS